MSRTTIIAEAGVNHNGSLGVALDMVEAAAKAGADVVKFQTFSAEAIVVRNAAKADYQKETTDSCETQLEMLKRYELSEHDHLAILKKCNECGIEFLSTPFDIASVELLEKLELKRYKLSSGDITNWPLIHRIGMTGKPLIISTGMSTLNEISNALSIFALGALKPEHVPEESLMDEVDHSGLARKYLEGNMTLLHCTTQYPTPFEDVNLLAMDLLRETFRIPVGYSDHTEGILVSLCAVAKGAVMIEKHFTLDKSLPGPDHKASITPCELASLVQYAHSIEKLLGKKEKMVVKSERVNMDIARKSLVALCNIKKGDTFTTKNLGAKRPGTGISPAHMWSYIGCKATKNYSIDEQIEGLK